MRDVDLAAELESAEAFERQGVPNDTCFLQVESKEELK